MNIAEILQRAVAAYPEEPAVKYGNTILWNFHELHRRVARLAGYLSDQGCQPGEKIAVYMENRPEYVELMFAAWFAGLAVVPVNVKLHGKECQYILEASAARFLFVSEKSSLSLVNVTLPASCQQIRTASAEYDLCFEGSSLAHPVSRSMDDLAWLFYTSGTTGQPKGAMQSHRNLYAMLHGFLAQVQPVQVGDSVYHGAPMSHGGGYYMLPFIARGGYQLIPESGGFDVDELTGLLEENVAVSFFAAPTMVKRLVDQGAALSKQAKSGLHTIIYGGGPMYRADLDRAHQLLGHRLVQIYGQGECPMTITALDRYQHSLETHEHFRHRLNSVGLPHFGIELKIIDPEGKALPANEVGEILVKGEAVMLGYLNNPDATASTLQGGWLHTGDVGYLDNDGFLYLTDRSKDVIISGGSNIYPREVEEVLLRHPAIFEVSVIGLPHADWGEVVVACIALHPSADVSPEELDKYCVAEIARFKRPKHYLFFDELPKNATGKILKTDLRDRSRQALDDSETDV